jgi:hypothetical protein
MKSEKKSERERVVGPSRRGIPRARENPQTATRQMTAREYFALAFGFFLGFAIVKFGNAVILESVIQPPKTLREFWYYPWPPEWSVWVLVPLTCVAFALAISEKLKWPASRWLWALPLIWFGWQLISATRTVDARLTAATLWQLGGCAACYFIGVFALGDRRRFQWMLIGLLAGFAFCLVRAAEQKLFEFPQERQFLVESSRTGWTNVAPDLMLEMRRDHVVISTNGVEIANPIILAKYEKGRVYGTLFYPNALAGAVLLLFPLACVLVFDSAKKLRPIIRAAAIAVTLFLGIAGLIWTGSKSGWLIALALCGIALFRLKWSVRLKWTVLIFAMIAGLAVFGIRFKNYFERGATSIGARFDYWRAAAENSWEHPIVGSGPGTFQRPYERLKTPEAEMSRMVHNDYLEQFSDSGWIGGLSYFAWIVLMLAILARRVWKSEDKIHFAVFLGLFGWFIQGLSEFGLYIPALAWTAFTLAGCLLALTGNAMDKGAAAH